MNKSLIMKSRTSWKAVVLHMLVWIAVFLIPYLLRLYGARPHDAARNTEFLYLYSLTIFIWIIIFYVNAFILTPRFLYKKKYVPLALILTGIFVFAIGIHWQLFRLIASVPTPPLLGMIGFNFPGLLMAVAASIAYRMISDKSRNDQLLHEKEQENMKSELSFLRSQISPHFMFNVLNNMLALARMKSDQLEPTILKLSSLMRYILYESDEEKVRVVKEAEYLQSYIDLQKQRIGPRVALEANIHIPDEELEITPMLLIPFIENAFKHGVGMIEKPEIQIDLHTRNEWLYFSIRNKFSPVTSEIKDKTSGIGLANVKRRLNLLYPERHNLLITDINQWFAVSLQINLMDDAKMHSS